jgi:hypothetical protein
MHKPDLSMDTTHLPVLPTMALLKASVAEQKETWEGVPVWYAQRQSATGVGHVGHDLTNDGRRSDDTYSLRGRQQLLS